MTSLKDLLSNMIDKINTKAGTDALKGLVKSVNGTSADEEGNVEVSGLPEGAAPNQQLVTDAEGNSKWEDKLAYSEIEVGSELFPEAEVNFNIDLGDGIVQASIDGDYDEILPGHIYKVTINGKSYTCQAYGGTVDVYTVGQIGAMPDEEYSESIPFAIYTHTQFAGDIMMVTRSDLLPNPSTIRIVEVEETVKTIDPKYIPKETIATITHNSYNFYTIVEGEGASREQICNAINRGQLAFLRCNNWIGLLSYSHKIEGDGTEFPNGTFAFFTGMIKDNQDSIELRYRTLAMMVADENGNIPNDDFIVWYDSRDILTGHVPVSNSGVIAYSYNNKTEVFGVGWANVPDHLPSTVPVISSATVGQTIVVKSVDENGKPTEWEAADMASGAGLPEGATAHQQLVTDGDGVAKWADIPDPIQADYAQNDPEQPDYIKNRLAYSTREQVAHESVTIGIYNLGYATLPYEFFPGNGEEYAINWDGTDYTATAAITTVDDEEVLVIGNTSFFGGSTNTDNPFGIISRSGRALVYSSESGEHTISLTGYEQIPHKIPREYVDHNPIVGVIDSSYYNYRYLNPAKGASIAEVRQAAVEGNRDIIIRLDLDNWQGTLRYMGLTNVSTDGTNYVSALLFSTIKANNVSINDSDEAINGTMQLEYWYALLEPAEGPPADAFVNFQFAEINLAPGTAKAGYYMRVNEDGFWEATEGPEEFSGSWNDLTDKPSIPSSWSDFGDREMEYLYHGTIVIENGTAEITGLSCPDNGVEVAVILTSEDGNAIYGSAMKYVYNSMANVSEYRYVSGNKVFDKIDCTSLTRIGTGSEMDDGNWILEIYDPNQDRINEIPSKFLPATVPIISSATVGQTIVVKSVDENGVPTEWEAADAGGGMPEGGEPFQQLVTDAEGNVKWEEPLARIGGHIEWRGNHDDDGLVYLEVDEFDMAPLVKVSNDILPVDKIGCAFLVGVEGINTGRMPIENEYINNNGTYWWTDGAEIVCILETTTFSNGVVGEPGVYFLDLRKLDESLYISDLYYDVEQLNSMFIPDDIARTYDIPIGLPYYAESDEYKYKQLVLNRNACPVWRDMLLYDFGTKEESLGVTSTLIPTPERQSRTDRIVYRGKVYRLFELEVGASYNVYSGASANPAGHRTWTCYMGSNGYPVIGNHAMLSPDNDVTYQDNANVEHYFLLEDRADEGLTYLYTNTSKNRYYTFSKIIPDIKLLDERFIPDTIARVSDIPETLTETRVNELITTAIAAIPAAEEASF